MDNWLHDIPPLRSPRKAKPKVIRTYRYDLKKLYYDARRVMFEREYSAAWKEGEYYDNPFPAIETTNGFSRYIEDVLNNLGHHCERVNTTGIWTNKGWRRSGSTKGSTDLHCIVNTKPWQIEVKKGADDLNPAQVKYQSKMNRIGVAHTVLYVGELDKFWDEFNGMVG